MTLAELIVKLDADISGLKKGTTAAERAVQSMGDRMQRTGKVMSAAITLPLTAIGFAATKMASDAEEAANKFGVVMGDSADRVNARLRELHETIPLTIAEMQGLTAGVQDMLVPMGVARSSAADMSARFLELAGDIGSFNNVRPDVVLQGIASALAGQSEPLRRYGVDVSKARLETLAFEHGLIGAGEALDRTAQAQAILLAIQADSTDAMGDAARTADSAANSFKFLVREGKELAITIGDILLPVITPMVQRLTAALRIVRDMPRPLQITTVAVGALAAAMGPLLLALGTLMKMLPAIKAGLIALGTPTAGTIGLVIAAVAALAFAATVVVKNWDVLKLKMSLVWAAIKGVTFDAIDGILAALEKLTGWIPRVGDRVSEMRAAFNDFATDSLAKSGEAILGFERALAAVGPSTVTAFQGLHVATTQTDKLADAARRAREEFDALWKKYKGRLTMDPKIGLVGVPKAATPDVRRNPLTGVIEVSEEFRSQLKGLVESTGYVRDHLTGLALRAAQLRVGFDNVLGALGEGVSRLATQFGPQALAVAALFDIVKGALEPLQPVFDALRRPLEIVGRLIGQWLAPQLELLVPIIEFVAIVFSYATEAVGWFIKGIGWLVDKLIGWFTDWGEKLMAFGQDMIDNSRAAREAIRAQDEATESLRQLNEQIIGAIRGFKAQPYRFGATQPGTPSTTPGTGGGGGGSGGGGGGGGRREGERIEIAHADMSINIQTSGDGKETYRNFYNEADQKSRSNPAMRVWFQTLTAPVG